MRATEFARGPSHRYEPRNISLPDRHGQVTVGPKGQGPTIPQAVAAWSSAFKTGYKKGAEGGASAELRAGTDGPYNRVPEGTAFVDMFAALNNALENGKPLGLNDLRMLGFLTHAMESATAETAGDYMNNGHPELAGALRDKAGELKRSMSEKVAGEAARRALELNDGLSGGAKARVSVAQQYVRSLVWRNVPELIAKLLKTDDEIAARRTLQTGLSHVQRLGVGASSSSERTRAMERQVRRAAGILEDGARSSAATLIAFTNGRSTRELSSRLKEALPRLGEAQFHLDRLLSDKDAPESAALDTAIEALRQEFNLILGIVMSFDSPRSVDAALRLKAKAGRHPSSLSVEERLGAAATTLVEAILLRNARLPE